MRKIPTAFKRDPANMKRVLDEITPGCEWVLAGEGVATAKWDGTAAMMSEVGRLWKRYEWKPKKQPKPPSSFQPAQDPDPVTGDVPGWVFVDDRGDTPEDRYYREALHADPGLSPGTYELCGPKVQGNPHGFERHILVLHGYPELEEEPGPRTLETLRARLELLPYEGIVWWRNGEPATKLKRRDLGLPWPIRQKTEILEESG